MPLAAGGRALGKLPAISARALPASSFLSRGMVVSKRRDLPRSRAAGMAVRCAVAVAEPESDTVLWTEHFNVTDGATIECKVSEGADSYTAVIDMQGLPSDTLLHWAVNDWKLPSEEIRPPNTNQADEKACQTNFSSNPITMVIPKEGAPSKIVFVLKVVTPKEEWYNNGSAFHLNIKKPDPSDIFAKAFEAECDWENYHHMFRLTLAMELLGQAEKIEGGYAMGFIFTWLRLANMKQLDWYRNGNYQPKDMGHVQKTIVEMLSAVCRSDGDPIVKRFARMTLAGLSRGGGDSEQIRLEILNIFRQHGIKEGHRPGIEDHFLRQWHQKLHSNTTVEDIAICEAYLHFLHGSGDVNDMYWHLWEYGGISQERLASMKCGWKSDGITGTPNHMPQMIDSFKHYLWILKTVHAGSDLDTMVTMAQGALDEGLKNNLFEIIGNREEWWIPIKVVEVREELAPYWKDGRGGRDVNLLDSALEKFFRLSLERSDLDALSGPDLVDKIELTLRNAVITGESEDLGLCLGLVRKLKDTDMWSPEGALAGYAVMERVSLALANYMDELFGCMQPHAEEFGRRLDIEKSYIQNFGEEVIRGHPTYILSQLLQLVQPMLRSAAGLSAWQVVSSSGAVSGMVELKNLEDVQGESFDVPTVLVGGPIGGMEDIPPGIVAVVCEGSVDVLSHVAIRARNQGVMLVACAEAAVMEDAKALAGKAATLLVSPDGALTASEASGPLGAGAAAAAPAEGLSLRKRAGGPAWVVADSDFTDELVGGKGLHLSEMKGALDGLAVPTSVALPFGSYEKCLADPANAAATAKLAVLQGSLGGGTPEESRATLEEMRAAVTGLAPAAGLEADVTAAMEAAGLTGSPFEDVWGGVTTVWASQWGERAWLSRRAMGVDDADLRMACLLQKVVSAQYAFVLHTANPITKDAGEMMGEVVLGLGETLVSNSPGRALSFTCAKDGSDVRVTSLPSKRTGLRAPGAGSMIARSDSNAEDLNEFAGAGLYDSVLLGEEPVEFAVNYAEEPLLWDPNFQKEVVAKLVKAGLAVEAAMGGKPQDIEGAIGEDGTVSIVQSRAEIL